MTPKTLPFSPTVSPVSEAALRRLIDLRFGGPVSDVLSTVLLKPAADLLMRPCKKVRGRLVELGFEIAQQVSPEERDPRARKLMEAIECLHAGSLAIDDIQDGSKVRRGEPALQMKYGTPTALTIGNWLYFWPLELVRELGLPAHQEISIYRLYHRTLVRAHFGQAVDVGVPVDTLPQSRVHDVCVSAMELKSGAVFSLALSIGAVLGDADEELLDAIQTFGHGFGIALQMFDDIGNLKGAVEPAKRWEDLVLRRPTWIWACAAKYYSPEAYGEFVLAVHQIPAEYHPLETWFEQHGFIARSKRLAHAHLKRCFADFERKLTDRRVAPKALARLRELGMEIARAYE